MFLILGFFKKINLGVSQISYALDDKFLKNLNHIWIGQIGMVQRVTQQFPKEYILNGTYLNM